MCTHFLTLLCGFAKRDWCTDYDVPQNRVPNHYLRVERKGQNVRRPAALAVFPVQAGSLGECNETHSHDSVSRLTLQRGLSPGRNLIRCGKAIAFARVLDVYLHRRLAPEILALCPAFVLFIGV